MAVTSNTIRWSTSLLLLTLAISNVATTATRKEPSEPEVITEPRPGEEYVLVSGGGGGPISASKPLPRGLSKTLTASFRTSHRIPVPTLRAAANQRANLSISSEPDPRSELEQGSDDSFQTSHKVTRQARRFDAEAPEVQEAASVDAEEALHREAPDDNDDVTLSSTPDSNGPTLLRLLNGPAPLAIKDLISDGPRLSSVEIRPEGNSGLRGVKLPTDEQEKKMMARKANATIPIETKDTNTNIKAKAEAQPAKSQVRKKVQKSMEGLQVAATSDIRVEPEADRGVRKRQGEKRVLLGTSTVTEVSVQLSGEDRTQKVEELNGRADLADLELITTAKPSNPTTESTAPQPATPTPTVGADPAGAVSSETTSASFDFVPVNLLPTSGAKERAGGKRRLADDDSVDFVDSPLSDKLLIPAGSSPSQSSRVSVKKGPNGQEYEYEYVYYYYDEDADADDNSTAPNSANSVLSGKTPSRAPAAEATSPQTPSTFTSTKPPNYSSGPKFFVPNSGAAQSDLSRGQTIPVTEEPEIISAEDPVTAPQLPSSGRNRYTSIDRNRASVSPDAGASAVPTATTPEPSSNEVLPSSRTRQRGRTLPGANGAAAAPAQVDIADAIPVPEERLPANTRFPPRGRGNQDVTTSAPQEGTIATYQETTGRPRVPSASPVRRPSLGLVDSSSFRTHASDASPDQDFSPSPQSFPAFPVTPQENVLSPASPVSQRPSHTPPRAPPSFPNALPAGPHRFVGVTTSEAAAPAAGGQPHAVRGQSHRLSSTAAPIAPSSAVTPSFAVHERPSRPHITTTTVPSTTPDVATDASPATSTHHYRIRGSTRVAPTSTTTASPTEEPTQATQPTRTRGRGPQRVVTGKRPQTTKAEDEEEYVVEAPKRPSIRRPASAPTTSTSTSTTTTTTTTTTTPPTTPQTPSTTTSNPQATEEAVTTEQSISTEDGTTAHTTPGDIGALDLYAILQQARGDAAQNALDAAGTALPDDEDSYTTVALTTPTTTTTSTTTTTTTTTTTEAPTTTASTTTTVVPAAAPGRGRYRARTPTKRPAAGASEDIPESASSTTSAPASKAAPHFGTGRRGFRVQHSTTTETTVSAGVPAATADEETSQKPKSRFSHTPARTNAKPFGRRGGLKTTAAVPEEVPVEKETVDLVAAAPESDAAAPTTPAPSGRRTPAPANRNRFRASGPRLPVSAASTAAPAEQPKTNVAERFNLRRRPQLGKAATTTEAAIAADSEGEESATKSADDDAALAGSSSTAAAADALPKAASAAAPAGKPGRARLSIGGGPRPLRAGPRVNIGSRPRPGATTAAPAPSAPTVVVEDSAPAAADAPAQPDIPADSQEIPTEASTAAPDALTRLRNRPRLRVHEKSPRPTPVAAAAPAVTRRQPSPLLRRGHTTTAPARDEEHSDSVGAAASPAKDDLPPAEELAEKTNNSEEVASDASTSTPALSGSSAASEAPSAPEHPRGLSSLLSRRRANVGRKPGSLYSSKTSAPDST